MLSIRRSILAGVGATATAAAVAVAPTALAGDHWGGGQPAERTYRVTILNLTEGQPLTPPVVATHRRSVDVFEVGETASDGVREIAENGDISVLTEALEGERRVSTVSTGSEPVVPTPSVRTTEFSNFTTFEITADRRARHLSWVSMLICSNDGFTGVDSVRLPRQVGQSVVDHAEAYDAGTEVNTQQFADIVPPCQGLVGVTGSPGTGESNPDLAEGGVVTPHPNVTEATEDGLQPDPHGWDGPIAQVVVTRVA